MKISVIIPTLNEEARIARLLKQLRDIPDLFEIVVSDGGSKDRTERSVAQFSGVHFVRAARGRARQMNAAAKRARGDVLLFLHADVCLPDDAAHWIETVLADADVVAGAFRTWTIDDRDDVEGTTARRESRRHVAWSWLLHLADLRSRYTRLPYGDQAIFVRASAFARVGGYPDQPLMEDLELSRRLRGIGKLEIAPRSVRVSGRRFLAHPVRYFTIINGYPLLYLLGVSPETLAAHYQNVR